jgi:hypothetical protein
LQKDLPCLWLLVNVGNEIRVRGELRSRKKRIAWIERRIGSRDRGTEGSAEYGRNA